MISIPQHEAMEAFSFSDDNDINDFLLSDEIGELDPFFISPVSATSLDSMSEFDPNEYGDIDHLFVDDESKSKSEESSTFMDDPLDAIFDKEDTPFLDPVQEMPFDEHFPCFEVSDIPIIPVEKKKKRRNRKKRKNTLKHTIREKTIGSKSIRDEDVLLGRGKRATNHPGNIIFRELVAKTAAAYRKCSKQKKTELSMKLVEEIHEKGGRFLSPQSRSMDSWDVVTGLAIRKKTSQALRDCDMYSKKRLLG